MGSMETRRTLGEFDLQVLIGSRGLHEGWGGTTWAMPRARMSWEMKNDS